MQFKQQKIVISPIFILSDSDEKCHLPWKPKWENQHSIGFGHLLLCINGKVTGSLVQLYAPQQDLGNIHLLSQPKNPFSFSNNQDIGGKLN
jgi:hypothetical protein